MSYVKQTWVDGVSPLNAERMNHIEEGIFALSGGGSVTGTRTEPVTYSTDGYVHYTQNDIAQANGYQVSDIIVLKAGEKISFESDIPDANVVVVLSRWNEDSSLLLQRIVVSTSGVQTVEYTAKLSKEYLRITHNTRAGYTPVYSVQITGSSSSTSSPMNNSWMENVEHELEALGKLVEEQSLYDCVPFTSIGVVGDSLASGAVNFTSASGVSTCADRPEYSWGKFMEREHGVDVKLFTQGGTSTRTWLTRSTGLSAMNSAEPCDCYIIGLGVNDSYSFGMDYLGTSADITIGSEGGNPDTFYGNYSKIIASLLTKSPRCKIFCLTMPSAQGGNVFEFNTAIRNLVGMYENAHLIDLENDEFFSSEQYISTWFRAHSTAPGYKVIAGHLWKLMDKYIRENISSFLDVQWIRENHD